MGEAPGYHANALSLDISGPAGMEIYYTLDGYRPTDTEPSLRRANRPDGNHRGARCRGRSQRCVGLQLRRDEHLLPRVDSHTIRVVSVSGPGLEDGAWFGDEPMHIEFFHEDGSFWVEAEGDSMSTATTPTPTRKRDSTTSPGTRWAMMMWSMQSCSTSPTAASSSVWIFKAAANDNYPYLGGAHVRDAYVQTLSALAYLHLDERTSESCILYINGQYWGVYEYREKVDDSDFTNRYHDQGRYDIDFLKTWGGTWEEYGDGDDWYDLVDFITGNDMTVDANYQQAISELNEMSLIDYFILNSYVVCADWLNWNTAWWRGRNPDGDGRRWRYALRDMDNTFGHGANYTGLPDTGSEADPCNPGEHG